MRQPLVRQVQGLTLIELMIVVAVMAVLAVLAAPSFHDMILMQRLRAVNAQLVTDLQFARSEAVQRQNIVRLSFRSDDTRSCYSIFISRLSITGQRCNCLLGEGSACTSINTTEVRTVTVPRALGLTVLPPNGEVDAFGFSPVTGGLVTIPSDSASVPLASALIETRIDDVRRLRTSVTSAGRPSVCAPNAAAMQVTSCP